MTKVKICGLMQEEHVQAAVEAGVDAIGFMFAPSKRRISIERAKELARVVPKGILKIGVFVDASEEEIRQAFEQVPLDVVQYHGDETPAFIVSLGYPSIKALSVRTHADVERAALYNVDYFLFDAPGTDFKGGSGHTFDWTLMDACGIPKEKVILAGGLKPENVEQAIAMVHPAMVDVSSGVEVDGVKDSSRIQAFLREAKKERM